MKTKNKPLTESDKIDIALTQVFDICYQSVPVEVWEAYKNSLKNNVSEYTEAVVKELQSKNFDATMLPTKGIVIKINTFKTCFVLESVPELQKSYNDFLNYTIKKRICFVNWTNKVETNPAFKSYNMYTHDKKQPYFIVDGRRAEIIEGAENNLKNAIKDFETPKNLATSQPKKALVTFFENELKLIKETVTEDWDKSYEDSLIEAEAQSNPAIHKLFESYEFQKQVKGTHDIYTIKKEVFEWFKLYDLTPVNDIDTVLQMAYANELKENYSGNINQLIQEKTDKVEAINAQRATMRASNNKSGLGEEAKRYGEQIKFLAYNKAEIENLIVKHATLA